MSFGDDGCITPSTATGKRSLNRMSDFWEQWEGEVIDGQFTLGRRLTSSEAEAIYETEGSGAEPAVIRLHASNSGDGDLLWKRWSAAAALSHENLIGIFAVGHSAMGESSFVYAVMERADEALDSVLGGRPLTDGEAREMLVPALEALRYLHKRNLVHGAIRPSNVMASGDTLKLSSDTVNAGVPISLAPSHMAYAAPELAEGVYTAASDVWSIGVLLSQALTLSFPEWRGGELVELVDFKEPFKTIVEHCLKTDPSHRWTVPQISDALSGRAVAESGPSIAREQVPVRAAALPLARAPLQTRSRELPVERERPRWVVPAVAIGALLVFLFAWIVVRAKREPVASAVASATASPSIQPTARPASTASPAPAQPKSATTKEHHIGKDAWFVVIATYSQRQAADHRAREITKKWPRFPAQVVAPASESHRFLVVIGSNLSENAAEALRQRGRGAGLPRDAYITRF